MGRCGEYPWNSPQIIGLAVAALAAWTALILVERRIDDPMLPLEFFRNRVFTVSAISTFLTGAGMFGAILFLPLFVQFVIGTSATESGLVLTPMMLGMVVSSIVAGLAMSKLRRYKFLAFVGNRHDGGRVLFALANGVPRPATPRRC